jgi:uncharacterized membrane protein
MGEPRQGWTDERVEHVIGSLLRAGVISAATVVIAGAALYLIRHGHAAVHYGVFRGEPSDLRTLTGIRQDALSLHGRGIIQLGLIILIATPVARVAFSVVAFALERDALYVVVTLVVLGVLIFSLMGARL